MTRVGSQKGSAMPRSTIVDHDCRRVSELWRSQGEAFLLEQAEILTADVDRLRAAYMVSAKVTVGSEQSATRESEVVIDLRDNDLEGVYCCTRGHTFEKAAARCIRCRNAFCADDIVRPDMMHGDAVCAECALILAGVNHKRSRPLVASGRRARRR